jgi:hypothetical protein
VEFMELSFALESMVLVGPAIELYQILLFRGDPVTRNQTNLSADMTMFVSMITF